MSIYLLNCVTKCGVMCLLTPCFLLRIPLVKMFTAFLECYIKYFAFLLVISSGVMRMELDIYRAITDSFLARITKVRDS